MTKRLAIIPARGGSKRIPGKNIRDFCGSPMISYILQTAKSSALFNDIHVSTEDILIKNIVTDLGFPPDFLRPVELSDDETPIMPVLKYVTEMYIECNKYFDEIWLLMPCAPLIDTNDLIQAAEILTIHNCKRPVVAVTDYAVPIEWAFVIDENGRLIPLNEEMHAKSSSEMAIKYHDSGTFIAYPTNWILSSHKAGSYRDLIAYKLPRYKAIDIDDTDDWLMGELLYKGINFA